MKSGSSQKSFLIICFGIEMWGSVEIDSIPIFIIGGRVFWPTDLAGDIASLECLDRTFEYSLVFRFNFLCPFARWVVILM